MRHDYSPALDSPLMQRGTLHEETSVLWYFPECKIAIISTSYAYMSMS
jgi:hypothetical protein